MFRFYAFVAALLGALSVAIGAFGAHGITDAAAKSLIQTGAHYHFMHAMAAIASLTFWRWGAIRARFAPPLFFAGICLFSGSLYAMAFGTPTWTGAITPIGGLFFLAGWSVLAWAALGLTEPSV
jgi:uncharacterized membrane protein YgdD (TMEM256/DUF423 family)